MSYFLAGAHGTGKTTLLQKFKNKKPEFFVTDGFSRPLLRGFERAGVTYNDDQRQTLLNEITSFAFQSYLDTKKIISTRSIVDSIAYSKVFNPNLNIDYLEKIWEENCEKVDLMFYIPIEFPLVADSERKDRFTDSFLQQQTEIEIKKLLDYIPHKVITLSGTVEQRLHKLINNL